MNSYEQLKLAAKAVKYKTGLYPMGRHSGLVGLLMANDLYWSPHADDGDAFRLMLDLDLSSIMVYTDDKKRREFWSPNSGHDGGKGTANGEEYWLSRLAILEAAVNIGKNL